MHLASVKKYFIGRRWTAGEIIADLEKQRRNGQDWSMFVPFRTCTGNEPVLDWLINSSSLCLSSIRTTASVIIRGSVLLAFINSSAKKHGE